MKKSEKKRKRRPHPNTGERGINRVSLSVHGRLSILMSNLRFSLMLRIAIHYALQLLRTTLPMMLIMTIFFSAAQAPGILHTMERLSAVKPENGTSYTALQVMDRNATAQVSGNVLPAEWTGRIWYQMKIALSGDLFRNPPVLHLVRPLDDGSLIVSYDLKDRIEIWLYLIGGLFVCDLWRISRFLRKRNRLNKSVLKPLRDITDLAATLSANNLSNRINIAGTKNELKDLAVVINSMLDRIELSYNSQKQFVSDASHELRTPISVLQGYINMLNRWGKEDKAVLEEGIAAISQETSSMKELVESLLFLARHDKKSLLLEMESFDPVEVIATLHREAKMLSPSHNFLLSPMEHCQITADKNMLKQVMRILCDNAVKYTPQGGTVTLGVKKTLDGCMLSVTDTGSGIAAEDLPKIFDRFYRADSARKSRTSGHGLGLSIARIIVIAHGGRISVRSKLGTGTTFQVHLPENQEKAAFSEFVS
jgi:two-component system, OmpR family, sensor histidine kinase ArlS